MNLFALVGVHLDQASDALLAALGDVVDRVARVQLARIHADERQLTDERVGHDLEHQRGERLAVAGVALTIFSVSSTSVPWTGGTSSGEGR